MCCVDRQNQRDQISFKLWISFTFFIDFPWQNDIYMTANSKKDISTNLLFFYDYLSIDIFKTIVYSSYYKYQKY